MLQSCPTLCDPIGGSPPGSPIPGILQAIPLLGIHTEETRIERDTCTPMFIIALSHIIRAQMNTVMRGVPALQDLTIGALEQATLLHPACDMRQKGSRGVIIFDRDWQRVWDIARDFPNQSSPFPQSKLRERWAPAPDEWADSDRPVQGRG